MSKLPKNPDDTSIPLKKCIRDRLKTYGQKGETYSDIIKKLMNRYDWSEENMEFGDIEYNDP